MIGAAVSGVVSALAFGAGVSAWRHFGRMKAEAAAAHSLIAQHRLTAAGAEAGLWHWDLAQKQVRLSVRAEDFLGLPRSETHAESDWLARVHPADAAPLRAEMDDFASGRISGLEARFRTLATDPGAVRWLRLCGECNRDASGRALALGGSLSDVTAARRHEEELLREAFHDALTGLPNRALFLDRIAHACARAKRRPDLLFGVMFLDIDGFKIVNDSLGHTAGDALLVQLAKRLEAGLRPADTLARLGGDEFTMLVEDVTSLEQVEHVAIRLLDSLKEPFKLDGYELGLTASIGIAPSTIGYDNPADLLRDADTAMYRAKAEGKARHRVFAMEMRERVVARMHLERDLHTAIEKAEFELHYQPIVSIPTGEIQGFEALVRWRRADGTLVLPAEFVPLAEETGQIVAISLWAFEEACRTIRGWRDALPQAEGVWVNVNVSSRQIAQPGLPARILELLQRYALPPSALRVEITETVMLSRGASECLHALRDAGIELHLDDFGTGYSSLSYLHQYPISGLKIDRSFISTLSETQSNGIVHSIIQLAANLSMTVTAEGVETAEQLECLRRAGCAKAQGYYFSPPRPVSAVMEMLQAGRLPAG